MHFKFLAVTLSTVSLMIMGVITVSAQDTTPAVDTPTPEVVFITATPETPQEIIIIFPTEESLAQAEPVALESAVEAGGDPYIVLTQIDADIEVIWPVIMERQSQYFEMTGAYFQGVPTHDDPPADGYTEIPDNFTESLSDQPYTWNDIHILPYEPIGYSVAIDVYQGLSGWGYVARFSVTFDGIIYQRAINYGPESERSFQWQNIPLE
jgi:hypothetical protein